MTAKKEESHIRVRLAARLLSRLERARERNGNTLSGEIVTRLEQSFEEVDRVKLASDVAQNSLEQFLERRNELARMSAEFDELKETIKVQEERIAHLQQVQNRLQGAEDTLTGLLGANKQKADFLRLFVLKLAGMPDNQVSQAQNQVLATMDTKREASR